MACLCIFDIVIEIVDYWQKLCFIILLEIDKNLEIYFYFTFLMFCLIVCLTIKSCKESLFNVKKIAKQ